MVTDETPDLPNGDVLLAETRPFTTGSAFQGLGEKGGRRGETQGKGDIEKEREGRGCRLVRCSGKGGKERGEAG